MRGVSVELKSEGRFRWGVGRKETISGGPVEGVLGGVMEFQEKGREFIIKIPEYENFSMFDILNKFVCFKPKADTLSLTLEPFSVYTQSATKRTSQRTYPKVVHHGL